MPRRARRRASLLARNTVFFLRGILRRLSSTRPRTFAAPAWFGLLRFFFQLLLRELRLKTAAAARLVHSARAHDDQLLGRHEALRVNGGISAAHADGQQLGDFLGHRQQARHRLKGTSHEIGVETGDDHALPKFGEAGARVDEAFAQKLGLIDADDFRARSDLFENFGARSAPARRESPGRNARRCRFWRSAGRSRA